MRRSDGRLETLFAELSQLRQKAAAMTADRSGSRRALVELNFLDVQVAMEFSAAGTTSPAAGTRRNF